MSRRSSTRSVGGLLVTLVIGVLAVTAVLLAVFALRVPTTQDAGEVPGPIPTWGGGSSPSQQPSPTSTGESQPVNPAPQFLSMLDGTTGIRSTIGSCTGEPAVVERTSDGGATWTRVDLSSVDVRQVLSLDYIADGQIDMVAAGATCSPTVVSSFTGGDYWEAYPDRAATATYIDPKDPTRVSNAGAPLTAPCSVRQIQRVGAGVVALCADGSLQLHGASGAWSALGSTGTIAAASVNDTKLLLGAVASSCQGVLIRTVDVTTKAAVDTACIAGPAELQAVTLDAPSAAGFLWSSQGFLRSADGGVTWLPTA